MLLCTSHNNNEFASLGKAVGSQNVATRQQQQYKPLLREEIEQIQHTTNNSNKINLQSNIQRRPLIRYSSKSNDNDRSSDTRRRTQRRGEPSVPATSNKNNNSYNIGGSPAYGSYVSNPSSSSGAYEAYGSVGSNSASGYGSYGAYGGASSSPRSSAYGGGSYSSTWGTGIASSSSNLRGGKTGGLLHHDVKIDLFKAIFFLLLISATGMLLTAQSLENHPEGTFSNCCRVSLHTVSCVYSIVYNLYHCRLGEIPGIICGGSAEISEDEYTEEELERMNLRPGIERALDVEHRKALRKVGVEMNMIKTKNGSKAGGVGTSSSSVQTGASIQR